MIDFYEIPPSPPCRAVKMLAKLLGIELNVHIVDLLNNKHLEPDYLKINPFHTVPAIVDNGFHLSESKAIMIYLVNKYAPDSELNPKDPQKRATVDQMLFVETGIVFPALLGVLRPQLREGVEPTKESLEKADEVLGTLNTILANRSFAAGDELTLADLSLSPTLASFEVAGIQLKEYPNVDAYLKRVVSKLSSIYSEVNDGPMALAKQLVESKKAGKK